MDSKLKVRHTNRWETRFQTASAALFVSKIWIGEDHDYEILVLLCENYFILEMVSLVRSAPMAISGELLLTVDPGQANGLHGTLGWTKYASVGLCVDAYFGGGCGADKPLMMLRKNGLLGLGGLVPSDHICSR